MGQPGHLPRSVHSSCGPGPDQNSSEEENQESELSWNEGEGERGREGGREGEWVKTCTPYSCSQPNPDCGDVPRLPKFNRREIPQVVIPRRPPPPKATPTAAQEPRKPSSSQPSGTSSSVPSTPTKQPGTPATLESAGDKHDGGDDHIKTDQTDGQASSSQKPTSTRVSTSSLDTSSSKTKSSPVIPRDKLVSFTSVEEDTESSKSIAHVFKKLTVCSSLHCMYYAHTSVAPYLRDTRICILCVCSFVYVL